MSPDGQSLNLDYDLYYHPWYNPIRWFHGPYRYYPRRKKYYWKNHWYHPWKKYNKKINNRINKRPFKKSKNFMNKTESPYRNYGKHANSVPKTIAGASARL